MVAKAIDEGKDTISFPTSTSILERTNTKPRKVGRHRGGTSFSTNRA
jgi:hypothetical protein